MPTPLEIVFSPDSWVNLPTTRFYGGVRAQAEDPAARFYLHHARRYDERYPVDGILTLENRPTVYLLRRRHRDLQAEAELHRSIWNQGVANLLVVCDPNETRIYSAHAKPASTAISPADKDARLVESLQTADFALQVRDFAMRLETGAYYQEKSASFSSREHVDRFLLNNLRVTRDILTNYNQGGPGALSMEDAHTLLGRVLFICYLHDRKIIGQAQFEKAGAGTGIDSLLALIQNQSPSSAREVFFRLLRNLKDDFNGSLFAHPTREEERSISTQHIQLLGQFLAGEEIGRKQMVLGFAAYDFGLIPIELISGIYEEFLAAESRDQKDAEGAFYTPKRLAEITAQLATEDWPTLLDKRVLDPSCGSGIFLVLAFNRMAEEWRHTNSNAAHRRRADALRHILTYQLCGVDKNRTACRIAAFSLYVAFFDQFTPRDLEEVRLSLAGEGQKILPLLLSETPDENPEPISGGLLAENYFSVTPERIGDFDLVLGNPPWVGRGKTADPTMVEWVEALRKTYRGAPLAPEGRKKAPISAFLPQKQSAHAFMWKVREHIARKHGRACLVLPSKAWLNKDTADFQRYWARAVTLDRVVQLADASFILFDDADCPCVLARFTAQPPPPNHVIEYIVPKVDVTEPGGIGCTVFPEDQKRISQDEWQNAADNQRHTVLWKARFWGTLADQLFIDRLSRHQPIAALAGEKDEKKRWQKGQGFQPYYSQSNDTPIPFDWPLAHWFLPARRKQPTLLICPDDLEKVGDRFPSLRRSPNKDLFKPPMVLTNQGFDWAAYCDFHVLFQHSIQSIHGNPDDAPLLKFLAGYLGSNLAHYFAFHTSANWGIERDKVNFDEMLRCPFPLPEQLPDPRKAWSIINTVGDIIEQVRRQTKDSLLSRSSAVESARAKINGLIFEYFSLTAHEQALVADTIDVVIPSSTPASRISAREIPTQKPTNTRERVGYAEQVAEHFARWGGPKANSLKIQIYTVARSGLAVLVLQPSRTKQAVVEQNAPEEAARLLESIHCRMRTEASRAPIPYHRGCAIMEDDRIVMIKPLAYRHWTYSSAFADAQQLAETLAVSRA